MPLQHKFGIVIHVRRAWGRGFGLLGVHPWDLQHLIWFVMWDIIRCLN
jgi:hypothetical protein